MLLDKNEKYHSIEFVVIQDENGQQKCGLSLGYTRINFYDYVEIGNRTIPKVENCILFYSMEDKKIKEEFYRYRYWIENLVKEKCQITSYSLSPIVDNHYIVNELFNDLNKQNGFWFNFINLWQEEVETSQWLHKLLFLTEVDNVDRTMTIDKLKDLISETKKRKNS